MHRLSAASPALKAAIRQLQTSDEEQFKNMCRALITDGANMRTTEQRAQALSFISEFVSEETYRKKTGMAMMTERQFRAWMIYREGLTADEAAAAWAAALEDPNTMREAVDGNIFIAVAQPEERSYIESVGKRQRLCETTDVGDPSSAPDIRANIKEFGPDLLACGDQANFAGAGASRINAGGRDSASASGPGRRAAASLGSIVVGASFLPMPCGGTRSPRHRGALAWSHWPRSPTS
jgi:hypothetical protein